MAREIASPEALQQATDKVWTEKTGETKAKIMNELVDEFSDTALVKYSKGRQAPQLANPTLWDRNQIQNASANVAPVQAVQGAQIGYQANPNEQQALDMLRMSASGQGPGIDAAQNLLRAGYERSAQQANALAASRGYNPAAMRGAQYQMSQANQDAALEAAGLVGQQQAQAQGLFLQGAQQQAAMQQQQAMAQAELEQQANIYTSTAQGQQALAQAELGLKAQLANQGIDLEVLKTNAQRGDMYALTNLEATMKQMGMDDAMVLGYLSSITNLRMAELTGQIQREQLAQAAEQASQASRDRLIGGILQTGGTIAGAYFAGPAGGLAANKVTGAMTQQQ